MGATGVIIAGSVGAAALAVTAASIPFVTPALRRVCIPYVPATTDQLRNLSIAISKCKTVAPVVDLGSGDGRVVLQCAAEGFEATGLELNSVLILYSKWMARRKGLSHVAKFYRKDMFKADLTKYKSAVIFGAEGVMENLVAKLDEMPLGSQLLACRFPLPANTRWRLRHTVGEGIDTVWLYDKCPYIVSYSA